PGLIRVIVRLPNDVELTWNKEQEGSFNALKSTFTKAPVLAFSDYIKPFTMCTDASGLGLGAVLMQTNYRGKWRRGQKRGLFNFVGLISNTFFGTATAEDVAKLGNKMSAVSHEVRKQNTTIAQSYKAIQTLASHMNAIVERTNQLTQVVEGFIR
ncbi:uncharacterized protein LOC121858142, partial [Homarus americanus]|uniref:uncharacterized protein LOC121858142 n=1 Tax=Homarus americanus TaxID=6706 RepID=UPI001C45EDB0